MRERRKMGCVAMTGSLYSHGGGRERRGLMGGGGGGGAPGA
jgi:hypothetical protein